MTLTEALKKITEISDNSEYNLQNYLKAINYISNLYKFHFTLKEIIPISDVEYLPTFKDCYLSEQLGIESLTEENELRLITVKSHFFLVDEVFEKITAKFRPICNTIIRNENEITFYLK